jgi:hypothetical protein
MWNETAIICEVIWVAGEQKYFYKRGWTDPPNHRGEDAWAAELRRIIAEPAKVTDVETEMRLAA